MHTHTHAHIESVSDRAQMSSSHEEIGPGGDLLDGRQNVDGGVLAVAEGYPEIGALAPLVVRCLLALMFLLDDEERPDEGPADRDGTAEAQEHDEDQLAGRGDYDSQLQQEHQVVRYARDYLWIATGKDNTLCVFDSWIVVYRILILDRSGRFVICDLNVRVRTLRKILRFLLSYTQF